MLLNSLPSGGTITRAACGRTIRRIASRVVIPNVRYRRDIGDRLIAGDFARVEALGLLDEPDGGSTIAHGVQRSCEQRQARTG